MLKQYFETNVDVWVMGFLLSTMGVTGWMLLTGGDPRLTNGWLLICVLCFLGCMHSAVMRRKKGATLTIGNDFLILCGYSPGFLPLLSGRHKERIRCADITCIKIGQIRELVGGVAHLPPLRVPFSTSGSMMFMWITYRGPDGQELDIYYPHVPRIRNYREALSDLKCLARSFPFHIIWYPPFLSEVPEEKAIEIAVCMPVEVNALPTTSCDHDETIHNTTPPPTV